MLYPPLCCSLKRVPRNVIMLIWRLRGSLVGIPEPGEWLPFVFVFVACVACVRAGEGKLRVPARCRVFLLGRPRLWEVVVRCSRPLCEAQDVVYVFFKATWVQILTRLGSLHVFTQVLRRSFVKHVHAALVLWPILLKPMCGAYHAGRISLKPLSSTVSEGKSSAKPW